MILVYGAVALAVVSGVWTGATRAAARSFLPLLTALAALLGGAGACYLIATNKPGYFLGVGGVLMMWLLLIAAGSLVAGTAMATLHGAARRRLPAAVPPPMVPAWDIRGLCALSAIAVIASLLE